MDTNGSNLDDSLLQNTDEDEEDEDIDEDEDEEEDDALQD